VKYGARKAAERLLRETGVYIVVWISMSIFDEGLSHDEEASAFINKVVLDTLKTARHFEDWSSIVCDKMNDFCRDRDLPLPVLNETVGVAVDDTHGQFVEWAPKPSLKKCWLEKKFDHVPTNLEAPLKDIEPLLECDITDISEVQEILEPGGEVRSLVIRCGEGGCGKCLDRGRSVAQEACMSYLRCSGGFRQVYRVSSMADMKVLQEDSLAEVPSSCRMLVWLDIVATAADEGVRKNVATENGRVWVVVSSPECGSDGKGGYDFPTMKEIVTLSESQPNLMIGYDWENSTSTFEEDGPLFGSVFEENEWGAEWEGKSEADQGRIKQENKTKAARVWKTTQGGEKKQALTKISDVVKQTKWFQAYVGKVKGAVSMLCQQGRPVTLVCIEGGPVTRVEQMEMSRIKMEIEDDLKVSCNIDAAIDQKPFKTFDEMKPKFKTFHETGQGSVGEGARGPTADDVAKCRTNMLALQSKFRNLHLILTGDAACCEAITSFVDTDEFEFEEHEIVHRDQLGPLADVLHQQAITLRGISAAGLLQQIGVDRFCSALHRTVIPGKRPVVALYAGDNDELCVRMAISSVGFLHQLRDRVLIGDFDRDLNEELVEMVGVDVELMKAISGTEIRADRTQFAEMYEKGILELGKLTPHQAEKKRECQPDGELLPECDTHIQAPAGGGKTFLGLHITDGLLKGDPEATVLFAATNLALAYFFANWLCTRQASSSSTKKVLKRLYVLTEDGTSESSNPGSSLVLQQFKYNARKQQLEMFNVNGEAAMDYSYSLLVVDEAHHLYRHNGHREVVEAHTGPSTRRILLSDVSQWTGDELEYPVGMKNVILIEVVRSSKRIVAGAMNFQTGSEKSVKLLTKCHHDSIGPPLKSYLFEASSVAEARMEQYSDEVTKALNFVESDYPGLELHNRVAISWCPTRSFVRNSQRYCSGKSRKAPRAVTWV
jgi:hypothetical protein